MLVYLFTKFRNEEDYFMSGESPSSKQQDLTQDRYSNTNRDRHIESTERMTNYHLRNIALIEMNHNLAGIR